MKTPTLLLILFGAIAIAPLAVAVPGPATSPCKDYVHQASIAIALQVQVGDNEAWADNGSCMHPKTTSSVVQWAANYSGPIFLGAATATWVAGTFTGCTMGVITQTGGASAIASAVSNARAAITMTSNECRGWVTLTVTITAVPLYTWTYVQSINIFTEQVIPSFPTTLNVVNSGTVNSVVSGELDVHQDPISGDLEVHQDQACGATFATRCYGELSGININQTVGNVTIPSNLTLNGGTPITVESVEANFWFPVFLWIVALVIFLRIAKLMAAAASTVGLGFSLLFPDNVGWQVFSLLLLGVALWLEATARERIYARFFKHPTNNPQ